MTARPSYFGLDGAVHIKPGEPRLLTKKIKFYAGDVVRTPAGKYAQVMEYRPDGRLDLRYCDEPDGHGVVIVAALCALVRRADD